MEAGPQLERRLGTADAVVMGLGSMIGAGIFAALAPADCGCWVQIVLIALAAAAVVAYLNATSSARCAARYPESGGTYVYGRKRLGEFWGYLAGWGFVVGKTASCAATALIVGFYAWPAQAHAIAVVAVLCADRGQLHRHSEVSAGDPDRGCRGAGGAGRNRRRRVDGPGHRLRSTRHRGRRECPRGVAGGGVVIFRVRRLCADRDPG